MPCPAPTPGIGRSRLDTNRGQRGLEPLTHGFGSGGQLGVETPDAIGTEVGFGHERVRFVQNSVGAVPGPFDCFLVHRGLRTLHLRMAAHATNAEAVVGFLRSAPGVSEIRWPGFSGMVSFRHPDAIGIAQRTKLFTLAESLGGVESLIEVPQAMTHQSVEGSAAAVPADLIRLSCGIEDADDLVADLHAAIGAGA